MIIDHVEPLKVNFSLKLYQNVLFYQAFIKIRTEQSSSLRTVQCRVLDLLISDCESHGISAKDPQVFKSLVHTLSESSNQYQNNVLDAVKDWSLSIPPEDLATLPQWMQKHIENNHNCLTLDPTIYIPFMQNCSNRELREKAYRAYVTRASNTNRELVVQILESRRLMANQLNFKTYAEYNLSLNKLAHNVAQVEEFHQNLRQVAFDYAKKEFHDLQQFANKHQNPISLELWDIAYWTEKYKMATLQLDENVLRSYFSFSKVLKGLFEFAKQLYGIDIVEQKLDECVKWDPHVRYFQVTDVSSNNKVLGHFFLDPYSRPGVKSSGAWANALINRSVKQSPVAFLICNQSLNDDHMSFDEVQTLFHEFGHCTQMILTTVTIPYVAGIQNVAWDAVELPSQFLENFCFTDQVLDLITDRPMSSEFKNQLTLLKKFMSGSTLLHYVRLGMLDMKLHSIEHSIDWDTVKDSEKYVNNNTLILSLLPDQSFLCHFDHIFVGSSYAAAYYSYSWAWMLDSDCFELFQNNSSTEHWASLGRKFRDTILALGGSLPSSEIYLKFRGSSPTVNALLKRLGLQ